MGKAWGGGVSPQQNQSLGVSCMALPGDATDVTRGADPRIKILVCSKMRRWPHTSGRVKKWEELHYLCTDRGHILPAGPEEEREQCTDRGC